MPTYRCLYSYQVSTLFCLRSQVTGLFFGNEEDDGRNKSSKKPKRNQSQSVFVPMRKSDYMQKLQDNREGLLKIKRTKSNADKIKMLDNNGDEIEEKKAFKSM